LTPVKSGQVTLSLSLLEFGQYRSQPVKNERYKISWSKDGVLATQYDDKISIAIPIVTARGLWSVGVQLLTDEVRKDLHGVLRDSVNFQID
jgi:hypothetical protein